MKLDDLIESKLYEDLKLIKFKYSNYKHDKRPKVKVLDFNYPGIVGQSTYGTRRDILGFNLNYFKNPRYASRAIDEIDREATALSTNKEEKYRRIKHFFPEAIKFLRRYNKEYISNLKVKGKIFYRPTSFDKLEEE